MDEVLVGQRAVLAMLRLPFSRRKASFHMIGYSRRSVPVLVSPSPRVSSKVHGLGSASDTTSVFGSARRGGRRAGSSLVGTCVSLFAGIRRAREVLIPGG